MPRFLILTAVVLACANSARADDITPETVDAVKKATVFVRVEGDGWSGSGSGFVIAADDKGVLIVTNHHVAVAKPDGVRIGGKPSSLSVVFDSGTKAERSRTCYVIASDSVRDLALLRTPPLKDAPRPLPYEEAPKLYETMPVYSFGFPFGKALASDQRSPAVTVGKASVSSLRNDADGELTQIQIDGNLNPGNSGGPVVDVKGRLVGIVRAGVRDGQGIGLAIPGTDVSKLLQGRVGRVRVIPKKKMDGMATVRVEVELLDPLNSLKSITAYYLVMQPKAKKPSGPLDQHPESKKMELKIGDGTATAEFAMAGTGGVVLVQVQATPAGKPAVSSPLRSFSIEPLPTAAELAGTPLRDWKEYAPKDRSFTMWVLDEPESQEEQDRMVTLRAQRLRVVSVSGTSSSGLEYEAQAITLPPTFARVPRKDVLDMFIDKTVADAKGRITETEEIESGKQKGVEYTIEADSKIVRIRFFVIGTRVFLVRITGDYQLAYSREAEIILASYRASDAPATSVAGKEPNPSPNPTPRPTPGPPPGPPSRPKDRTETAFPSKKLAGASESKIYGGAVDPDFSDLAPEGGFLVGFEVGLKLSFGSDMIRAIRPIYRVGDKESFGEQHGDPAKNPITLKAKPGYAVATITIAHFLYFDGMKVTYMKVVDGKLDPKDSYVSDYVGANEDNPRGLLKVEGGGLPVVGIIGKCNDNDLTGIGLLFKEMDKPEPKKKP